MIKVYKYYAVHCDTQNCTSHFEVFFKNRKQIEQYLTSQDWLLHQENGKKDIVRCNICWNRYKEVKRFPPIRGQLWKQK
jgi:hypothetical protein